jgi:hypothetical protein
MFANVIYSPVSILGELSIIMYRVFFTTLALSLGRTEAYMILANVEIWNLVKEKPNKET